MWRAWEAPFRTRISLNCCLITSSFMLVAPDQLNPWSWAMPWPFALSVAADEPASDGPAAR